MKVYKAIEGTETYEQYGEDFIPMWRVAEKRLPPQRSPRGYGR